MSKNNNKYICTAKTTDSDLVLVVVVVVVVVVGNRRLGVCQCTLVVEMNK